MSCTVNGLATYGVVCDKEFFHRIAQTYEDFSEEAWNEWCLDYIQDIVDGLSIESYGEFTGEVFAVKKNGDVDWEQRTCFRGENLYILPLQNHPTLMAGAYHDIKEVVEELRMSLEAFFQNDLSYSHSVKYVVGVYWS